MNYLLSIKYKTGLVYDEVFKSMSLLLTDLEDRILDNKETTSVVSWTISPLED